MKSGVKVPLSDQELSDMRQDYLEGKDFLELAAKYSRSDGYIRYLCSNVRRADQPWPGGIGILKQGPLTREEILKRAALVKAPLSDAEITHLSQQYRGEEKDGNLGQFAENYRQNRPPPALTAPPEEATNTVNFMGSKALHTLLKSYAKDNGLKPSMAIAQIISQHMNLEVGGLVETDTGKKDHPFFMSDPTVVALLRSKVRQTNVSISQMCRHLLSHGLLQIKAAKQSEKRPMTPEEVREIRKQFLAGKKIGELGKEFCRDGLAIYYICNNLKHSDVPWPGIGLLRPGPLTLKEIKDQVARARKATNNK